MLAQRAIVLPTICAASEVLRVQTPKTVDDIAVADLEMRGLKREANAFRRILRLPIESQKLRAKKLAAEEKAKEEPELDAGELD